MGRSAKVGGKNIDRARKLVEARPYKLEEAAEVLLKVLADNDQLPVESAAVSRS